MDRSWQFCFGDWVSLNFEAWNYQKSECWNQQDPGCAIDFGDPEMGHFSYISYPSRWNMFPASQGTILLLSRLLLLVEADLVLVPNCFFSEKNNTVKTRIIQNISNHPTISNHSTIQPLGWLTPVWSPPTDCCIEHSCHMKKYQPVDGLRKGDPRTLNHWDSAGKGNAFVWGSVYMYIYIYLYKCSLNTYVNQKNLMAYISRIIRYRFIHLDIASCHSSKTLKKIPLDSINLWSEVIWIHPGMWCVRVCFCWPLGKSTSPMSTEFLFGFLILSVCQNHVFNHERSIAVIQSFHFYPNPSSILGIRRFQVIHNTLTKIGLVNTEYDKFCHWFGTFSFIMFHPYPSDTNRQLAIEILEFLFLQHPKSSRHILEQLYT